MRTFYAALHSCLGSLSQPEQCFLQLCDCYCILSARELAPLETFESLNYHIDKVFVANTIGAAFENGPLLKMITANKSVVFYTSNLEIIRCIVLVVIFDHHLGVLRSEKVSFQFFHYQVSFSIKILNA